MLKIAPLYAVLGIHNRDCLASLTALEPIRWAVNCRASKNYGRNNTWIAVLS
jgi:hypothetical protein